MNVVLNDGFQSLNLWIIKAIEQSCFAFSFSKPSKVVVVSLSCLLCPHLNATRRVSLIVRIGVSPAFTSSHLFNGLQAAALITFCSQPAEPSVHTAVWRSLYNKIILSEAYNHLYRVCVCARLSVQCFTDCWFKKKKTCDNVGWSNVLKGLFPFFNLAWYPNDIWIVPLKNIYLQ